MARRRHAPEETAPRSERSRSGRWAAHAAPAPTATAPPQPPGAEDRRGGNEQLRAKIDATLRSAEELTVARAADLPGRAGALARRLGAFRVRRPATVAALDVATILWLFVLTAGPLAGAMPVLGTPPVGLGHPVPWLLAVVAPLTIVASGGFHLRSRLPGAEVSRFGRLFLSVAAAGWLTVLAGVALTGDAPLGQMLVVTALLPLTAVAGRLAIEVAGRVRADRVVVLGTGYVASRAAELVGREPKDYELVGHVDDQPLAEHGAGPVLGGIADLPAVLERHRIDRVVVAFSLPRDEDLMEIVRACDEHDVDVDIVPRLFEFTGLEPCVTAIGDLPIVHVRAQHSRVLARVAKRLFDIVIAGLMLLVFSPVLLVVAVAILLDDGRPVLYRQRRIGRQGRPFDIFKFRTMVKDADRLDADIRARVAAGEATIDQAVAAIKGQGERDPRILRVGRFLRKTSLDELPQLANVVKGDMSLVGPRPLRPFEVEALDAWQLVRQRVRPGITGLWQVLGRSELGWQERMNLDYAYVRHWSPVTDMRILAETIPAVLEGEGAR